MAEIVKQVDVILTKDEIDSPEDIVIEVNVYDAEDLKSGSMEDV